VTPALPPRLRGVSGLVPPGAGAVADVGAGHGALAAHLAVHHRRRVIATEVAPGPFAELQRNLVAWNLTGSVDVRCGDGLAPLHSGEVEVAVIAGVGANTALAIAEAAPARGVRWLILQCMQRDQLVEPWLSARGWPVQLRCDCAQRGRCYTARLVEVTG
jgi:tRNA (adenine22-N1)-methyltransferase